MHYLSVSVLQLSNRLMSVYKIKIISELSANLNFMGLCRGSGMMTIHTYVEFMCCIFMRRGGVYMERLGLGIDFIHVVFILVMFYTSSIIYGGLHLTHCLFNLRDIHRNDLVDDSFL